MAPKFGLAPDMQARFPAGELGLEATGVSLQGLAPNATQPFGHSHKTQEEVYLVLSGSGRVKLDDEIVELRRVGRDPDIAPGHARGLGRPGRNRVPGLRPQPGHVRREDAEPKPGWWNGEGAGV